MPAARAPQQRDHHDQQQRRDEPRRQASPKLAFNASRYSGSLAIAIVERPQRPIGLLPHSL